MCTQILPWVTSESKPSPRLSALFPQFWFLEFAPSPRRPPASSLLRPRAPPPFVSPSPCLSVSPLPCFSPARLPLDATPYALQPHSALGHPLGVPHSKSTPRTLVR